MSPAHIKVKMIVTIIIGLILWFVVPLLIDGRVKRKSDSKAYKILCRIVAAALIIGAIWGLIF